MMMTLKVIPSLAKLVSLKGSAERYSTIQIEAIFVYFLCKVFRDIYLVLCKMLHNTYDYFSDY